MRMLETHSFYRPAMLFPFCKSFDVAFNKSDHVAAYLKVFARKAIYHSHTFDSNVPEERGGRMGPHGFT